MKREKILVLAVSIFALNLLWEFLHYSLYVDLTGIPRVEHILIASFTDLLLAGIIITFNSFLNKSTYWIEKPRAKDYSVMIIIAILISAAIEIYSLKNLRWAYTSAMPQILGIGLSPLVQLPITITISILLMRLIQK